MPVCRGRSILIPVVVLLAGCGPPAGSSGGGTGPIASGSTPETSFSADESDAAKVKAADVSILFVGNSHTTMYDLPSRVCEMIRHLHPDRTTYAHSIPVVFLEDVAANPRCREELETRPWKYVVLQAQKISVSGRHEYSRAEAIDFAKLARTRGAGVVFYPEWGLKDVPGDGPRQEKVYREMAQAAGASVAPVGRAWDRALARRPGLDLYAPDGNHQSATGAFLTACVLVGRITGESPAPLASFPDERVTESDRKFLAGVAAEVLDPSGPGGGKE